MPGAPEPNPALTRQILASLDLMDETVMVLDREWRVVYVNETGVRRARRPLEDLLGKSLWSLYESPESLPSYEAGHRAVTEGRPTRAEVFYAPHEAHYECQFYPTPEGVTLVFRDITHRKRAADALEGALAREQRARQEAEAARAEAEASRESSEALMEELQTQREELEVSHEEAQAVNEELHAANEELTFFNRELTRSRDELQRLRDEADTVQRIGSSLAAELDLNRLVQSATDAATQLCGAQFGAFFYNVRDDRGESYSLYTLSGVPREAFSRFPMPRNTAIFAPTFAGRGIMRLDDVTQDPRFGQNAPYYGMPEGHLPVRSYLAVPVISRSGEVLGGLFFGHSEPGRFRAEHERMLAAIAGQAAVALDNARLYEEARRVSDSLRQSEERYRSLVQAISEVVWTADAKGKVREDMPGWREITGKPLESILGDGWLEDVHPDDRERAKQAWMGAHQSRSTYAVDYRVRARDGAYRHLLVRGVPVFDASGEVREWVGLALDVTERRRLEQALVESEELFRSLVEQSPLSVQILSPDGWTLQVNRAWEELWGATLEHLKDYNMLQDRQLVELGIMPYVRRGFEGRPTAIPPVAYDRLQAIPDAVPEGEEPHRWVRAHIYPVRDSEGTIRKVVLIHEDFTERHRLEAQLQQRVEELAEADRRKDEFLAMLAHELRNPLAPILNSVAILNRISSQEPTAVRHREIIGRQSRQMARLLEDLLDVSRVEQGKIELRREPVSVSAAIEHAVEATRPWSEERGHRVALRLPEEPLAVEADPARLEQILVNLLSNAIKYTDEGGEITVSAVRDEAFVAISVRDTGVGIPAEFLPQVFDLFTQGHRSLARSEGGLGIGLTLTRTLVQMHGGAITAHSAGPGLGSDFVIRLPLTLEAPVPAEPPAGPVRIRPLRILIVEDNRDAAETLSELLAMDDHQVQVAHEGKAGLELAGQCPPEVAILDIGLPGISGYEVARRLRAMEGVNGALLVAVTGYGQAGDRQQALEAGFNHHLTKPVDPEVLQHLFITAGFAADAE